MIRLLVLVSVLVLSTIVDSTAHAGTVEFTDTVRVVMGSRESQDECRVYATQEAKRRVLDKVGVYLSGSTEIVRKVEESFGEGGRGSVQQASPPVKTPLEKGDRQGRLSYGSFSDTTSVLQRIQTLTVGVVQTEVVSEEWKTEGGAFVLYLVCRVKVDPEDALNRLTELLKDKEKVEDYQKVQEEVARLRTELEQLRSDLANAKSEPETKAVKEEVQEKIDGLTAVDWYKKGQDATNIDDQIACYSIAIQLNPNLSWAYHDRGVAYGRKEDSDKEISDLSRAIQIAPTGLAYMNRGHAYRSLGKYNRAIEDYNRVLLLVPGFVDAYLSLGYIYSLKKDYDQSIDAYTLALQGGYNAADAYFGRGITYYEKGDYGKSILDYSEAIQAYQDDKKRAYISNYIRTQKKDKPIEEFRLDSLTSEETFRVESFDIDANIARSYYNRGLSYYMLVDDFNARRDFQNAADLGDEDAKRKLEEMR